MQQLQPNTLLQGGKYRIVRVLGQGGFGITYLAVQVALNRYVAIKEFFIENLCDRCVNESTIMRTVSNSSVPMVDRYKLKFLKEARIISELHHENIINVYDVFEENGTAYYVMEYIDGGSLGGLLQQRGTLPENEAINYITRIVHAVDYLHQRRINHFDIKPDNIMLRRDGTPVLIDFGISKQYDQTGAATTTTPVGISNGYAPIEQYSPDGVATFSPQTDIYSLGATLYKLVTGQTPPSAPARSGGASFYMPTALRASTRNAISGAMKINKDERIGSARQFLDVIVGATGYGGQPQQPYGQPPMEPQQPYGQRPMEPQQPGGSSAWIYIVAGLIVIALIIAGCILYENSQNGLLDTTAPTPAPVDTTVVTDSFVHDSVQVEPIVDEGPKQKGSETFVIEGISGENQVKYRQTYTINVEDGTVSWTYRDGKVNNKGSFKCNPSIDADIIIAECKSVIYWEEAGQYFWFMSEEFGSYRYEEFQLGKKALGLSSSYMSQARETCPNAFQHVQSMYQELVNCENGGDLWSEIEALAFAIGEHPLEPCDLYNCSFV